METGAELAVVRASELAARSEKQPAWLIEELFSAGAVGLIGGPAKTCKSWLSLEMAVAVASGRPCLERFEVPVPGPVLLYAAEDAPVDLRDRLAGLAQARHTDFASLDVGVIMEPSLRLDRREHLHRLAQTLSRRRPRLLILDPYVRLQRVDENNSTEVSAILGALRDLSRAFEVAIALVHHTRKTPAEQSGLTLRGTSDFHAWGDSNLYLSRRRDELILTIEHRSAASPPPLSLGLVIPDNHDNPQDKRPVRLEVVRDLAAPETVTRSLPDRVLEALNQGPPRRQEDLRALLQVRNQRLTEVLRQLQAQKRVTRVSGGWLTSPPP